MRLIIVILAILFPFLCIATRVNMTVSGGNINNLTNAQSTYGIGPGDTLAIPITLTGYCGIGGLTGTRSQPIVVVVNGKVFPFQLEMGSNFFVKFYFKLSDSTSGMVITGAGRGLVFNGTKTQNCSWHGIRIPNPSDYPVFAYHSRTFNGNLDSTNHNLLFDSLEIHGGAALIDGLNFNNNGTSYLRGLWDSVTFRNCYIHDMQGGNVWSIQHFFHGYWENITVKRTGTNDTRHVGVIHFGDGQGVVNRCYFYNTYGNKVRWKAGTSLVASKSVPMDTNIVMNSVFVISPKYGMVESNSDASTFDTSSTWIRPTNYLYANINVGRFHDSDYTDAAVVADNYRRFGFLKAYNIVCWDMENNTGGASPWIHHGDGTPTFNDTANLYYGTASQILALFLQDTVVAVTKLNSFGNTKGTKLPTVVKTSYNSADRVFAYQYDVGAYQWTGRPIFSYRRGRGIIKKINN